MLGVQCLLEGSFLVLPFFFCFLGFLVTAAKLDALPCGITEMYHMHSFSAGTR